MNRGRVDAKNTQGACMSPTIMRIGSFRFFFNSNEENRMHVHVQTPKGVAKFWLEPIVSLAEFYRLDPRTLRELMKHTEENVDAFKSAWKTHLRK